MFWIVFSFGSILLGVISNGLLGVWFILEGLLAFILWKSWIQGKIDNSSKVPQHPLRENYEKQAIQKALKEKVYQELKTFEKDHADEIQNVLSLKKPSIQVDVNGHAKRTLELRCGFAKPDEDAIYITLIKKDSRKKSNGDEDEVGETYLCRLPNGNQCYAVIGYERGKYKVSWFVKTFFPVNYEEWFKHCAAQDLLLKDDQELKSIDRIEWHDKLVEKIERKRLSSTQ